MSEPTRYRVANNQAQRTLGGNVLVVDPAGRLVEYADYARLHSLFANSEQENARLKAEVERLTETIEKVITAADVIDERNQRLIAEVERLRKAGDDLAGMVGYHVPYEDQIELEKAWNAAKEGKPSV
ncbi:hypothetical protein UFOVP958_46 [uncultured Caudovirales phage]|uniref:Coil containing protein n=1 Tax=uncultured Caudovirales phage TaxID=2100421 RepID=A0A6J5NCQ0_9CAUD|nr:hypothetical protein UFOVP644_32 [uncultured Caudovirales phage]CAB4174379.1 hypothetical protein UFOVP958_46 [uncultured Caudovirales phage]CAB4192616.1 hypothetical protein UFOVP1232_46 [uncultured Caudovirales phage]CAB5230473.1 hypothetical protein UFOVP1572_15 [uncultured Caudovirales phage]